MTKREQRVINAFCNCVKNSEFTEDYAITLIEDSQRYGWLSNEAKDAFYEFLDTLPVEEPEPEEEPIPEPTPEPEPESDPEPENNEGAEEPVDETQGEMTEPVSEEEEPAQEETTETEPETTAGGEGE